MPPKPPLDLDGIEAKLPRKVVVRDLTPTHSEFDRGSRKAQQLARLPNSDQLDAGHLGASWTAPYLRSAGQPPKCRRSPSRRQYASAMRASRPVLDLIGVVAYHVASRTKRIR